METSGAGENLLRLRIHRERPRGEQERRAVEQFNQRLGTDDFKPEIAARS